MLDPTLQGPRLCVQFLPSWLRRGLAVNAPWLFSVNPRKTGFVATEGLVGLMFNELLLNQQEIASQISQQTGFPDGVLIFAPEGTVNNDRNHDFEALVGLKLWHPRPTGMYMIL